MGGGGGGRGSWRPRTCGVAPPTPVVVGGGTHADPLETQSQSQGQSPCLYPCVLLYTHARESSRVEGAGRFTCTASAETQTTSNTQPMLVPRPPTLPILKFCGILSFALGSEFYLCKFLCYRPKIGGNYFPFAIFSCALAGAPPLVVPLGTHSIHLLLAPPTSYPTTSTHAHPRHREPDPPPPSPPPPPLPATASPPPPLSLVLGHLKPETSTLWGQKIFKLK